MIIRSLLRVGGLLCVVGALSACGASEAPRANCFNFRDAPARSAIRAATVTSETVEVTRRDAGCEFVRLGMGG